MYDTESLKKRPIFEVARELGMKPKQRHTNYEQYDCFSGHDNKTPSLTLYKDSNRFYCFGCNAQGDVIELVQQVKGMDFLNACEYLGGIEVESEEASFKNQYLSTLLALEFHNALSPEDRSFLQKRKGLTDETINKYLIGKLRNRFTIPIFNRAGYLVNIRMYSPDSEPKMLPYEPGRGSHLYGAEVLDQDIIICCEGEWDRLMLMQNGFPAVTGTAGAATFKNEWAEMLRNKIVYLCYDHDESGRKGQKKAASMLRGVVKKLYSIDLSGHVQEKGDISDLFLPDQDNGTQVLRELMEEAKPIKTTEKSWLISIKELLSEDYGMEWLVEDWIPKASMLLVTSAPKVGKTLLTLNLAQSVATGQPFLGQKTAKGSVIIIQLEDSRPVICDRLVKMGMSDIGHIFFSEPMFRIDNEEDQSKLKEAIEQHNPGLIIVDPFAFSHHCENENDSAQMAQIMRFYREIVLEYGLCIVIVHHDRKSGGANGMAIRGSSAIFSSADMAIELTRNSNDGSLKMSGISRVGKLPELSLRLSANLHWICQGDLRQIKAKSDGDQVIDQLLRAGALAQGDLKEMLRWGDSRLNTTLEDLMEKQLVICNQDPGSLGRPKKLYQLANTN